MKTNARSFAVVVGIGSYKNLRVRSLQYAVKDAIDVSAVLSKSGWMVSTLTSSQLDAQLRPDTGDDIENRIRDYAAATKAGDALLFFYSGHGFVDADQHGYICPIGVDPSSKEKLEASDLSVARIRRALESGQSKQRILILDACRNEPIGKGLFGAGFTEECPRASEGTGILYATAPGKRSFEPKRRPGCRGQRDRERAVHALPLARPGGRGASER